jgi:hypothetical protein
LVRLGRVRREGRVRVNRRHQLNSRQLNSKLISKNLHRLELRRRQRKLQK